MGQGIRAELGETPAEQEEMVMAIREMVIPETETLPAGEAEEEKFEVRVIKRSQEN